MGALAGLRSLYIYIYISVCNFVEKRKQGGGTTGYREENREEDAEEDRDRERERERKKEVESREGGREVGKERGRRRDRDNSRAREHDIERRKVT